MKKPLRTNAPTGMQQVGCVRKRRFRASSAVLLAVAALSILAAASPSESKGQDTLGLEEQSAAAASDTAGVQRDNRANKPTDATFDSGPGDILVRTGEFVTLEGSYAFMPGVHPAVGLEPAADTLRLEFLRGKLVLLDFWASWCRPCIEEIPETNAFASEFGDREDFVFISVNQDAVTAGGAENVRDFVRSRGIEYPVLIDEEVPSLKKMFTIRAWPTRIMISPDGELLELRTGRLTLSAAAEYLRSR